MIFIYIYIHLHHYICIYVYKYVCMCLNIHTHSVCQQYERLQDISQNITPHGIKFIDSFRFFVGVFSRHKRFFFEAMAAQIDRYLKTAIDPWIFWRNDQRENLYTTTIYNPYIGGICWYISRVLSQEYPTFSL